MNYKKFSLAFAVVVLLCFVVGDTVRAALTLGSTSITSSGDLTLSGSKLIAGNVTGNARGTYATDIQMHRNDNAEIASGTYAVALGNLNRAAGAYSVAAGYDNIAAVGYSAAVGYQNQLGGVGATYAFGYQNNVDGGGVAAYSIALGSNNTVNTQYSSALGYNNTINNTDSIVVGNGNTVTTNGSVVIGRNITGNIQDAVMIGTSNTTKLTIRANGFVGVFNSNDMPDAHLQVGNPGNSTSEFTQIDAINGAPAANECNTNSGRGRMIYDYTNHRLYVCDGVSRSWDYTALTD